MSQETQSLADALDEAEGNCLERLGEILDEKSHPYVSGYWDARIRPAVRRAAEKHGWAPGRYHAYLTRSLEIFRDLHLALHFFTEWDKEKPKYTTVWQHRQIDLLRSKDKSRGFDIDRGSLLEASASYVKLPELQNDVMDWLFLDALVFSEIDAFGDEVMSGHMLGSINWAYVFAEHKPVQYAAYKVGFAILAVVLAFIAPPAIAISLAVRQHEGWGLAVAICWGIWLVGKVISFPARWKVRRKAQKMTELMFDAYATLGGSVISPRRVREAVGKAADDGVIFDGAVFAIIDRAEQRDPTALITGN